MQARARGGERKHVSTVHVETLKNMRDGFSKEQERYTTLCKTCRPTSRSYEKMLGKGVIMVQGSKVLKVELSNYGSYLGRAEGCFEIRDKTGKVERYPHFQKEIGEAVLKSGSYVSVDALIDLALWNIDTYIMTRRNRVVAFLKNVEDDSHVETRLCQYEALNERKRH